MTLPVVPRAVNPLLARFARRSLVAPACVSLPPVVLPTTGLSTRRLLSASAEPTTRKTRRQQTANVTGEDVPLDGPDGSVADPEATGPSSMGMPCRRTTETREDLSETAATTTQTAEPDTRLALVSDNIAPLDGAVVPTRGKRGPVKTDTAVPVELEETEPEPAPEVPVVDNVPVELRPYQAEAIEACLAALDRGLRRIGVSSPTGSGKTTMFMSLLPRVQLTEGGQQVLILVGSVELARQAEAAARQILGSKYTIEVEQAKRVASGKADITIATYQTLNNWERLQKFDPENFKLVIVDEAHHAAALSYLRLLHYFNDEVELPKSTGPFSTFNHRSRVPIIGFSATFTRHDQLALRAAFEEIVFHRDVGYMLEGGWLSPAKLTTVTADLHLDNVSLTRAGEYNTQSLARHVNTPSTNRLIVGTWLRQAADRRSTLVFAVNLKHVDALVHEFRMAGVDARSISSQTDAKHRKETIEKFATGEFSVLVNCEVLTEGTDIREIDCIVLARPTRSKNLLAQMVGRGLRLSPESGKEDCYLVDIADNISRASGLSVLPTLFGLSYDERQQREHEGLVRGDAVPVVDDQLAGEASVHIKKVTLVDSDDPFGIEAGPSTDRPIVARITPNAWVWCGDNKYILDLVGSGWVTVSQEVAGEPWNVWETRALPQEVQQARHGSRFRHRMHIAQGDTLERALHTADAYAERQLGRTVSKALRRNALWRSKPASPKQLELLVKTRGLGAEVNKADGVISVLGRRIPLRELTAGDISTLITGSKNGALAARRKRDAAEARVQAREQRRLDREAGLAERNLPLPRM